MNNGRLILATQQSDRNALCIRTEFIEGLGGLHARENMVICLTQDLIDIIVEVPIDRVTLQILIVCIGIRAVATAVDITIHISTDTDRISAIDSS